MRMIAIFVAILSLFPVAAFAQDDLRAAPTIKVTVQSLPAPVAPTTLQPRFDAARATEAYLAKVHGQARARSDAYFEGGYVLIFVDAVYAIIVAAIILWLGLSKRMRDVAEHLTQVRSFQIPLYVASYIALTTAMSLPLAVYEEFFREHAFGLSNQNFGQWLGDFGTASAVNLVVSAIVLTVIYAVIRRAPKTWWLWGTLVAVLFLGIGIFLGPVFVAPLFNHYMPLKEGPFKSEILSIVRAEGIPATDVYEFDASRQTKRISANVSGLFGTTRISMNDNLLKRCDHDEIIAVLGHEMGHYVLNHAALLLTWYGLLFLAGFAFVNWGYGRIVNLYGADWGVRGLDDVAGLPVLAALMSFFFLVATPVSNTITRSAEAQADIFGINAVRKPDGFARATLMLSEYRKLDPSPLEEFVFYDHPSGRSRILMAMRWKLEHRNDWDVKNGPVSPQ